MPSRPQNAANSSANTRPLRLIIPMAVCMLLAACAAGPNGADHDHQYDSATTSHELTGTIVAIDADSKVWYVNHEEIPGYMDAMVMPFQVPDDQYWTEELSVGKTITGTIVVAGDDHRLEDIEIQND
ncbi:copper-binding protein [Aquisalimonas sp.]|uniref:copper-binding protein n=1 Tax=Aquisalimonas sp. TaxID=1872621 RepID=UPI0025C68401|nr:copper-binding protein [Aquisalimonas sp.]